MASSRNAPRRLLRELETWRAEQEELQRERQRLEEAGGGGGSGSGGTHADEGKEGTAGLAELDANDANRGIERLGPAGDADDLFRWEAVINGEGVGGGYDDGRWLLSITVPSTYPLQPPTVRFATPVMHANVHPTTGAVCLDLLQAQWTPTLTVAACVRAVRLLLSHPGTDSPLNIDLAALLRAGDAVAAARLVALWCDEYRYNGM